MERGGHVRKGEKGRTVVLWRWFEDDKTGEERASIRYFTVFSTEQCEGIEVPAVPVRTFTPIEGAERIVAGLPEGFARIRHGVSGACYVPDLDEIRMPSRESFVSPEAYYQTLFHESVHASGREGAPRPERRRGARPLRVSHDYSEEELVAEMGSAFLGNEAGILPATLENTAAYLRSWVRRPEGRQPARHPGRGCGAEGRRLPPEPHGAHRGGGGEGRLVSDSHRRERPSRRSPRSVRGRGCAGVSRRRGPSPRAPAFEEAHANGQEVGRPLR